MRCRPQSTRWRGGTRRVGPSSWCDPMSQRALPPSGIVVVFSRPSDFAREQEWSAWYAGSHLPATADACGARAATWWENTERPATAVSPVGFTHVAIYELDDIHAGAPALLDLFESSSAASALGHPAHTIIGVEVMRPAGSRWRERLDVGTGVTGQVLAYVGPNDPAREGEWNRWVDGVHVPDMVGSGAFANATRWVRTEPMRFGLNYLTIYDVTLADVAEAVALSAAAMGPARAH